MRERPATRALELPDDVTAAWVGARMREIRDELASDDSDA